MEDEKIDHFELSDDLRICRIINGMWQTAGGHGQIKEHDAINEMLSYHGSGLTTWDMADIYGPAEEFLGKFRMLLAKKMGLRELGNIQALTKFVPSPGRMTRATVEHFVDKSRRRMGVDSIDLLQFHWWDYNDTSYLDALYYLSKLQGEKKIRTLGLTNFDTERLQIIIESGFKMVSNQVQYSVIDQRPEICMVPFCQKHGMKLLTYGTLLGGFLSEGYLGAPEPTRSGLYTLSLQKYKHMIDVWGGWGLFQELLEVLDAIAQKHGVSIANVATRYILDKPNVAGVIIGARLGISEHISDNCRVFRLRLESEDLNEIRSVTSRSNDLYESIGDCGAEYR